MLKMRFFITFVFIASFLAISSSSAQRFPSPLAPGEKPRETGYGLFLGIGNNAELGSIRTDACDCEFTGGNKVGYTAGLLYEKAFNNYLMWGVAGILDFRDVSAAFKEWEFIEAKSLFTNYSEEVKVQMRHTADLNLTFLTFYPYLKFTPFDFFYVRLGPGLSYLASSNIKHTKYLVTSSVILSTQEEVSLSIGKNGTSQVIEDNQIPNTNAFQCDIISMIGFNIPFGYGLNLSPGFMFAQPLTSVRSGDSFKTSAWRIFIELRFVTGKNTEEAR
jgi:hypothetical protein